jgi:hypothetical protein
MHLKSGFALSFGLPFGIEKASSWDTGYRPRILSIPDSGIIGYGAYGLSVSRSIRLSADILNTCGFRVNAYKCAYRFSVLGDASVAVRTAGNHRAASTMQNAA